ncbi:hypothetical protein MMC29_001988 [Sticta canariensis]|nr:hypothetical protein [Sticta canariensis]
MSTPMFPMTSGFFKLDQCLIMRRQLQLQIPVKQLCLVPPMLRMRIFMLQCAPCSTAGEVKALRRALAEMTAERNECRDANYTFRKLSANACEMAKMEEEQKVWEEKQKVWKEKQKLKAEEYLQELSLVCGQMQRKMVEVAKDEDEMDEEGRNGASRKRQRKRQSEEKNPRAATKIRIRKDQ